MAIEISPEVCQKIVLEATREMLVHPEFGLDWIEELMVSSGVAPQRHYGEAMSDEVGEAAFMINEIATEAMAAAAEVLAASQEFQASVAALVAQGLQKS